MQTERDLEILRLRREEHLTYQVIGRRYDLTGERVRQILAKLGATGRLPLPERYSEEMKARLIEMRRGGAGVNRCAREAGTGFKTMRDAFLEWGVEPEPRVFRRDTHGTRTAYDAGCRCADCRAANATAHRDYQRERYRDHAARGLCYICIAVAAPGRRLCRRHLEAQRETSKQRAPYYRERYRERVERGLCPRCSAGAVPGRTLCERHLAALREAGKRRARHRKAAA